MLNKDTFFVVCGIYFFLTNLVIGELLNEREVLLFIAKYTGTSGGETDVAQANEFTFFDVNFKLPTPRKKKNRCIIIAGVVVFIFVMRSMKRITNTLSSLRSRKPKTWTHDEVELVLEMVLRVRIVYTVVPLAMPAC